MSVSDAITAIGIAYPQRHFTGETAELYGRLLRDLDPEAVTRAIERLIKGSEFMPTVHAIRTAVAEETLALPSPEEAWDMVTRGNLRNAPPEVRAASAAVGGRRTIMSSDNLPTVRAQFLKSYAERRRNTLEAFIGARATPALPSETIGETMRALPESKFAAAPPVHARWLNRMMGRAVGPPTEAEKAHAIEILRDGPPTEGEPDGLYIEAERVFMEASE